MSIEVCFQMNCLGTDSTMAACLCLKEYCDYTNVAADRELECGFRDGCRDNAFTRQSAWCYGRV